MVEIIIFVILDIIFLNCLIIYNYSDFYHKINKHSSALYYRKILLQQLFNYFCPQDKIEKIKIIKEIHILIPTNDFLKSCENCKKEKDLIGKNYPRC